jgi:hypothetical protein
VSFLLLLFCCGVQFGGDGANAVRSSSPLNGQAAELWEKDMEEYKRLVLARHKTPEELDA